MDITVLSWFILGLLAGFACGAGFVFWLWDLSKDNTNHKRGRKK